MTTSFGTAPDTELALRAGEAAAAVLPSLTPLSAMGTQAGTEHVTASFAGATTAQVVTKASAPHRIAILVGKDLVDALKDSPLGGLDLAAATQPAVDAIAEVLSVTARAAIATDLSLVVSDLGGPFTVVPLIGEGIDAAVLLPDVLIAGESGSEIVTAAGTILEAQIDVEAQAALESEAEAQLEAQLEGQAAVAEAAPAPAAADAPQIPAQAQAAPVIQPVPSAPQVVSTPMSSIPQQFNAHTSDLFVGTSAPSGQRGIEMLAGVDMEVTVELGRTRMAVRDLLALAPGTVLELDRAADGPADLLVNGRLIARGEVVVVDEDFGLRITEIIEDTSA